MTDSKRQYIAIDLKSFYASVECVERGLDPLTTPLVVADASRTEKTICLAVTPALKAYGIPGRARLYEVIQKVSMLKDPPEYIVATPRMNLYMEYSTKIYNIYMHYVAPEDIHVYSVDEVFMDVTEYLNTYKLDAVGLARKIIMEVLNETGITATAGIGTNLYLAKIAMDIMAKRMEADEYGVRIAALDEMSYRRQLWTHEPITDFWRVGRGIAKKLREHGMLTMGDVARCSLGGEYDYFNRKLLYKLFGVNASLLIDHAWGYEPCLISEIKAYKPENSSLSQGQVLSAPYPFDKAKLVVMEMTDQLILDLVDKNLLTDQIVLTVGYDRENLNNENVMKDYSGNFKPDHYGRVVPEHAHGSENLGMMTSSTRIIMEGVSRLFDRIVDKNLTVRRMYVVANHIKAPSQLREQEVSVQMDLFTDYSSQEVEKQELEREKRLQQAILSVKKKYGKNALIRGMNLEEGATAIERNAQVGGHKA